jgi:hypothetical protein
MSVDSSWVARTVGAVQSSFPCDPLTTIADGVWTNQIGASISILVHFQVNMSIAILPMSVDYGWDAQTVGLVQSSFFWGYLLTQVAGGVWADRIGGKKVLGFGVIWWSVATVLTPFAATLGLPALLAARACMGVGEVRVNQNFSLSCTSMVFEMHGAIRVRIPHPVKVKVVFQLMKVRLLNRVSTTVGLHGLQTSLTTKRMLLMGPGDKSVFGSFANAHRLLAAGSVV